MRRNRKWKWMAGTTAACVLVGALGVGGTIAYMTDNEAATNTFTVGKVQVDLTEPDWPGNDDPSVKNLVSNQEVQKDPQVTNTGVNDAIVFMSVEVPVKDVTVVGADGTKGAKEKTELFWLKDAADGKGTFANHFSDQWMELTSKGEKDMATGETNRYVFAYKTAVAKDAATDSLFDKIQLKNVIEGEVTAGEAQNVVVNTYAIQASEVLDGNTDLTDAMTEENLGKIYDIYFNQNPEKEQGGGSEEGPEVVESIATLMDGQSFSAAMSTLAGGSKNVQSIKNTDTVPEDAKTQVISTPESAKEAVMYFDEGTGTIYIATDAKKICLNSDSNGMFKNCISLTNVNGLSNWDVSNVTNMNDMFSGCQALTNVGALSGWETGNVTDMYYMFDNCYSLTDLDGLSDWNTSNVTNMSYMFSDCKALTNVGALSGWETGNVTDMHYMFYDCGSLTDLDGLSNWNTSNVATMNHIFHSCNALTTVDNLSNWNISNVTDISSMFHSCAALTNINGLSGWDVSNVTNMSAAFAKCTALQDASGINDWNVVNVSDFWIMFSNCPSHPEFTKRPGTWDNRGTFTPTV